MAGMKRLRDVASSSCHVALFIEEKLRKGARLGWTA